MCRFDRGYLGKGEFMTPGEKMNQVAANVNLDDFYSNTERYEADLATLKGLVNDATTSADIRQLAFSMRANLKIAFRRNLEVKAVIELQSRILEARALMERPDFKECSREYIVMRKWFADFANNLKHTEVDRTNAALMCTALKWQFHGEYGIGVGRRSLDTISLSKRFEYKHEDHIQPTGFKRNYFAYLTSECRRATNGS